MANSREPWFVKKRIGWGYNPNTWQGWLVLLLAVAAVIVIVRLVF